jgi:hypothetical protein
MKHKEIKSDMINGINSMNALGQWIKNEDLRDTIRVVQNNVKKHLKRGNRSI